MEPGGPTSPPGVAARPSEGAVSVPSRRSLLKGGLAMIAAAAGWSAGALTSGSKGAAGLAAGGLGSLELEGAEISFGGSAGAAAGSARGEILGAGGAPLGAFAATPIAAGAAIAGAAPGSEMQVFELREGSIFGLGTPNPDGGAAAYAVIGGTGRYAGASGAYTAEVRPVDLGGDGTARFSFTFAPGDRH